MKKKISGKIILTMAAAALCMAGTLKLEQTLAYFTTYVSAGGSQTVHLGTMSAIHEEVSNMTKHVSITNTSQLNDCFVRVKVFYGKDLDISFQDKSENGSLWTYSKQDGYWYYKPVLPAGESTGILDVKIGDLPEDFDKDSFNIVVIQECTPVIYDEAGNPTADWTAVYTDYQETAGAQGEEADRQ